MTIPIVGAANKSINNILAPASLMFVHVILAESLESTIITHYKARPQCSVIE
jgi:hypothetical protein